MLSNRITALRNRKGISQAQLAQMLHISPSTVGMYEQGRRIPNVDILVLISKVFDVSLDYLITGSDYLYSNVEAKKTAIIAECPCSTCYWKEFKNKKSPPRSR